ncbi:coiled-coil domain-containing protein 97 [Adelges cooleyi]|uniref:coiled-coil domain-containing protein 97 n=1 Tax=Adelges cooleyi TaxID=133065 RepID=UPI00217F47C6|nr:coiled-coil domain-containing protein 97 [Adelges cooleyi]
MADQEENTYTSVADPSTEVLKQSILDHITKEASDSVFKSQQIDEPDISADERRKIAEEILNRSHSKFLYKFGDYLLETHFKYFKTLNETDHDVNFHLHRLSRSLRSRKVICKNRRYQALLEMVKGDYFNDSEMRNREPLLWEQLVGQYLSPEEKLNFDHLDTEQNTLTGILLEQIDRDSRDNLKQIQESNEAKKLEEDISSDEESMVTEVTKTQSLWGEYSQAKQKTVKIAKIRWKESHPLNEKPYNTKELSKNERFLLLNEFRSHMFHKFLSGQEEDFDYSKVDDNPAYDNLAIQGIDEEEKYFDSESPETSPMPIDDSDNDDELDIYMKMLQKNEMADGVTDKFKNL